VVETFDEDRRVRRRLLQGALGLGALHLAAGNARAQTDAKPSEALVASQMPVKGVGLEHIGTTVKDVTPSAKFFGRVFNTFLYKEKDPPLRYYVTLDPGYIAIGGNESRTTGVIDHDCVLADGYDRAAMAVRLEREGFAQGNRGIFGDPDGLRLQLLTGGGLAATTEPAGRLVDGEPLVRPRGLHRVLRLVTDVDRSTAFYRKMLGGEPQTDAEGTWFKVGPTRFGIRLARAGETPRIDRFCVNVAAGGYDRDAVAKSLAGLGATIVKDDSPYLHFQSPDGIGVELRPVDPAKLWDRT
jgi:catechol 2,3-dioxygenase-like lactoylglutathione lyase family enzyme